MVDSRSTAGVAVVIAAAGSGARMGGGIPKQFRPLAGKPMLRRTVEALRRHPAVGPIVIVGDAGPAREALEGIPDLAYAAGGAERQDSVRAGLEALAAQAPPPRLVLIHDAARPFVDPDLTGRVLAALEHHVGAIPALPVVDTLKRGQAGLVGETVPRDGLFRAQTPQGFRFAAILDAHRRQSGAQMTDDAALATAAGLDVALVPGAEENFKVTTADDLDRAERALLHGLPDIRTGSGFDVHALGLGDGVWLGGVKIAHDRALIGHSDADVALHALTDALLGAIGAGDIGQHFPPSEPQWRGASSDRFLAHAGSLVAARGGMIAHLDLTVICERPKVGPHREAMRQRISAILGIAPDRVSVKATTTEKLGFTGRGEGIAAQGLATVRLP
ncbi:bifunctional 2-C-methyl-D-erythritol 4-phosphate cytidylyltransferase/2-C-methyl-D-erythritol 2,4-cyclodiphosphate synthase [Zavarzinia aquatilis]|uniref:Bifunctional enzyme IspD/IspF n=1 Tax=Zavarzinia aquatilis TaxID=2211142 RepID=A0A317EHX5_9PROT|nr:bifunctional 2-C-methyl-D-erythritol 4-phosphate cytidylyltransferase/2-C-methyl-D-erythritol 2,4-cyclodiphosphate synthase [Zavarzinia aquatilis]PWR25934.1 bifunctional 2-C-methyl-D-erythritol 4-phosphate cytidylyltransferase/2-C-methyl-D-erythritol 2,4-cyclodiphosphate synthase [Zavarzinia aquatilis]